jgi:ADP-ribose pyrophosphatase
VSEVWLTLGERELLRVGHRLRVVEQHVRLPDGREISDYLQFAGTPYVTLVAQIADGRLLCERQYKHGPGRVILTLPSGTLEPGEEPPETARRELLEETGYASEDWRFLAAHYTHANAGGSVSHAFLARHCHKIAEPNSGDLEAMTIELKTFAEVLETLSSGGMPLASDGMALIHALIALGAVSLP